MSDIEFRPGEYGEKVMAVEPGGVEAIPAKDRHGKGTSLFAVWASPNLEFATIYVGALGVLFGLSFTQAVIGIVIGNALGAYAQYVLTQDGPKYGVPQLVVSRAAFGKLGNIFPSVTNWIASGIGWFAVNSVSGALALASLTHMSKVLSLLIVVIVQMTVAFIGHNLVQKVEKYLMPYLVVVFGISGIIVLTKSHLGGASHWYFPGAWLVFLGAVYGYAAGWNPFASDYARYLPATEDPKVAGRSAALGLFTSAAILEIFGAAAVTAIIGDPKWFTGDNPVADYTSLVPSWLGKLVLLGIVLGSICANALNVYSGSMSLLASGVLKVKGIGKIRAITTVIVGILGFFLANWAMGNPKNNLEHFLLVMAYWIGPWLGVITADKILRKGASVERFLFASRENPAGPIAFLVATGLSIWLFSNQSYYVGYFPKHNGNLGDITFLVGFALAFALYFVLGAKKVKSEK